MFSTDYPRPETRFLGSVDLVLGWLQLNHELLPQIMWHIVAGPDDPGVPRDVSELIRDEIPGAAFDWLSPAKHLATLEHPEQFNRMPVDFLAKHAG